MFSLKRKEQPKEHKVPLTWIERATKGSQFTPDIQELEQYEDALVFLYNEAMEGHRANGSILYGTHSVVPAYTLDTNLSLWNKNLGKASFPIALNGIKLKQRDGILSSCGLSELFPWDTDDVVPGRVKGELHLLVPAAIKRLDEYMLNGVQFERKRVRVLVPHTVIKNDETTVKSVHVVRAYFYQGITEYWKDQLDCGIRYSIFPTHTAEEKWLKTYYEYKQDSLTPPTVSKMHQL